MILKQTDMIAGAETVGTELIYLLSDPFAVHMEFTQPDGDVVLWSMSRETMRLGLSTYQPLGDGDISCCMCWHFGHEMFHLGLHPYERGVQLHGHIADFRDFLYETYIAVPPGKENQFVDYEQEIAKLLGH